jgi:hypothetical protein
LALLQGKFESPHVDCYVTTELKCLLSPSLSSISEMEERVPEGRERRARPPSQTRLHRPIIPSTDDGKIQIL